MSRRKRLKTGVSARPSRKLVGMPTYDKGDGHHTQVPDDVDLKSGCTMDVGSFLKAIQAAANNAK